MTFKDGRTPPKFYLSYVADIQNIICANAAKEFEAIWAEHQKTGKPRSVISTELSQALNRLSEELEATDLFDQPTIRHAVMAQVFPKTLIEHVGLEKLCSRIPRAYASSAFAAFLAADFIYRNGPNASAVAFYKHVSALEQGFKPA